MYKKVRDPWDQKANYSKCLMDNSAFYFLNYLIKESKKQIFHILDIGCANGYYAESLLTVVTNEKCQYIGTDISKTVLKKIIPLSPSTLEKSSFVVDDIRIRNKSFLNTFDLIFTAKTLYYVAPEIDEVIKNIVAYLRPKGIFCFTYNTNKDVFSNKWLTYGKLRKKLQALRLKEKLFVEINRFSSETLSIGIYER